MSDQIIFENLAMSTIRIECRLNNGDISTGTGFFFKFVEQGTDFVPAIITNKHVIEDAVEGKLFFTLSDKNGNPIHDQNHKFIIENFQRPWLEHPDPNIDLCALPINVFVKKMNEMNMNPYITFLDFSILPTPEDIEEMIGLERIVMVGYPNGLWDEKHNQPVFRNGILASHYKFDWNGKSEFVIDAGCFPGSSGSPVLIIDIGQVLTKRGFNIGESRIKLLGILYAGPVLSSDGSLEIIPTPTVNTIRTSTDIPINLGYVIKASKLREFNSVFEEELEKYSQ